MKFLKSLMVGAVIAASTINVHAQGLGDILSGLGNNSSGSGNVLTNIIEGVFTKTNLSLADLVGEYQAQGPAVTFKSDNLLQKAGGIAGAATIVSKLNPYYEQYGLNNMVLTVDQDANFTMKIKALSLKGTITKNDSDGTFDFNFKVAGISLGKFTAYVEKSGRNLNLMFDASKLKDIISAIAKFTGNSMASALGSILDSYDGACIGWKMVVTSSSANTNTNSDASSSSSSGSSISSGLETLKGILNKGN
ncbi:MAG: DUF4923 family protein [Muribaculaceae bacterium]|nr:DUF4923 family protein [Muribaculaceae bacterium]